MKKITLSLLAFLLSFQFLNAQGTSFIQAPPYDNGTSANRAPNGTAAHAYMRGCALVLQSELTNIPANTMITDFGFTVNSSVAGAAVTGNFTLYVENTTDVAYSRGTNYLAAITTMSTAYNGTMGIPVSAGTTSITVTLTTPFLYTGGGLYVAYDWFSAGPFSTTAAVYQCNYLGLNPGCATGVGTTAAPTTLGTTNFRPVFLWGITNSYTNDIQYVGIESAIGRVPAMLNTPQNISAVIKNVSNQTNTNILVDLLVTGANAFANTQTVSSLAAGASATVTFAAFNPLIPGANTISVSVPSDQNNVNNSGTFSQTVTCNEWGLNPAPGNYTSLAVGFGAGSGILACSFSNPSATTLTAMRSAVSNNAPSVGNSVWGVLMNAAGAIIATTNTVTLTTPMLGTFQTFTFATPQNLSASTTYYFGFAQPANTVAWYPAGSYSLPYMSTSIYYNMPLAGGTPAVLAQNLGYFGIEAIFTPTVNISAPSQTISCGSTATLSASGANSYSWSTTAITSTIVVNPVATTNYVVTGSDAMGCSLSKTVSLFVDPMPISIAASNTVICEGVVVTMSATGAPNYTWTAGTTNLGSLSVLTVTPPVTTAYQLVGSDPNGCSTLTTAVVIVIPSPTMSIISSTNVVCLGQNVTLNATGAPNLLWSNGSISPAIVETPTSTSTYTVVGTNTAGCSSTITAFVTVNSFTPGISPSATICNGDQITILSTGGSASSYLWSNGITIFPQITVGPAITTIYSVSATSATNSCLGVNATTITVNPTPTLTATANRTIMCRNESNTVTVNGASNYTWSTGAVTSSFVITPTVATILNYTIYGTDVNNCSGTAALLVKVDFCTALKGELSSANSFEIYPNPGNGKLTIRGGEPGLREIISVYNTLGKLIRQQEINSDDTALDLSSEASGVYIINISRNNVSIHNSRIIKE